MVEAKVSLGLGFFVLKLVSENLYVNGDPLRSSTEKLVSAHGIGRIPAPRGPDVLPAITPGAPVHEFASRVFRFLRDALFLQGHLETVVRHGAVLSGEKLQDHVPSARIDTRHSAAAAELGDLEDLPVHIFQQREVVAAVTRDILRRPVFSGIFVLGYLKLYKTYLLQESANIINK